VLQTLIPLEELSKLTELELFRRLGVALGVGLLIGLERGWQARQRAEGGRPAGIRTFGLLAFLGAVSTLLSATVGPIVMLALFLAVAALLIAGHLLWASVEHDFGVTTQVAGLLTFVLGCLAMAGYTSITVASAVVATVILGLKPVLHRWVERLEGGELHALFRLLLMSAVVLPVLPDRNMGPWQALNPRAIWWLVVLVATVSFIGYFAVKIAGPRKGLGLTAAAGGLASSTATTFSFSRIARVEPALTRLLSAGVLLACSIMFARVLALVSAVNPALVKELAWPLGTMTVVGLSIAGLLWRRSGEGLDQTRLQLKNPVEIGKALQFGIVFALISLLAHGLLERYGEAGLYYLAAISGIADVDATTLSLSSMAKTGVDPAVTTKAIVITTIVNSLSKGCIAWFLAGSVMGRRVLLGLVVICLSGVLALALA
jgi:uncharacterized membrane protein (DUF4010 family)